MLNPFFVVVYILISFENVKQKKNTKFDVHFISNNIEGIGKNLVLIHTVKNVIGC